MRRSIVAVSVAALGLALITPGAAQAKPEPPSGDTISPADQASLAAGLGVAPKAAYGAKPKGPNPFLAQVPDATKADYAGWANYMKTQAKAKASARAKALALAPKVGELGYAPTPENVHSGAYPLRIPIKVVVRRDQAGQLMLLLRFLLSEEVAEGVLSITENRALVLLLVNLLLLVVGCFLETIAAITILVPVLLPLITKIGVDPVQFGIIMTLNLVIGLLTPPVGLVITPTTAGMSGMGCLRALSNRPSACSFCFSRSSWARRAPTPATSIVSMTIW